MNSRKILAFAVGPVLSGLLAIFTIPLLAWFFQPEDIGRNNIYQVCMSFSVLFFGFGLDQAYVREYHESEKKNELLKTCYIPGFFAIFLFSIGSLPFWKEISTALFGVQDFSWYLIVVLCGILTLTERFFSLSLRMQEKGLLFSLCQVFPKVSIIVGMLLVYKFNFSRDYLKLLLINLASLLTVVAFLAFLTRKNLSEILRSSLDFDLMRSLLMFGLPLVGAGVAYWGLSASTSIVLRHFSGFKDLGLYSMAMSLAGVVTIFQTVFTTVWMPTVFKWVSTGENFERVDSVIRKVVLFVGAAFCLVGIFSFAIEYVLPKNYHSISSLLVCSVAQPLLYTLSEVTVIGLAIKRKSSFSLLASLCALFANLLLCLALVPDFGASGAVAANAAAYAVFLVARTEFSALFWRAPQRSLIYGVLFFPVGGALISVIFSETLGHISRLYWGACLIFILFFFRKDVADSTRYVSRRTMS